MASSKNNSIYKTVPKLWEIKQVKEITLGKNAVLTGPFGLMLHSSDYVESGIPLILVKNIKNGKIDVTNIPYVTEKDAQRLAKYRVKEGDIVFSRVGRVGSSALIEKEHEGWLISGQTLRIRFNNPIINPKYINYFFQSDVFSNILSKEILGMTRDSINTTILSEISVLVPTLSEQEKIISIISRIDNLIELYDKIIQRTIKLKTNFMQQIYEKITKNGKKTTLKNYFEIQSGEYFTYDEFVNDGIPVLKIDNIMYGKTSWKNITYLPQKYSISHKHLILNEGDIVLALNRPITQNKLKISRLTKKDCPSILYQRVGKFVFLNELIDKSFFFALTNLIVFKKIISDILVGSDQPYIKTTELLKQKIIIPDLEDQIMFAEVDKNISKSIELIELIKNNLQILKKGLMQKLLTGQIRV